MPIPTFDKMLHPREPATNPLGTPNNLGRLRAAPILSPSENRWAERVRQR